MLGYYDTFNFGKHKGKEVNTVLLEEPDYILWLEKRTKHKFEPNILKHAERLLDKVDNDDYHDWSENIVPDIMDRD